MGKREPESRFSRRTMMKAAGVGTAAVWVAPKIDAVTTGAARASAPGCLCDGSGSNQCYNGPAPCIPANSSCFCRPTGNPTTGWDGGCSCRVDAPGGAALCDPTGACPTGFLCVQTCLPFDPAVGVYEAAWICLTPC